MTVGIALLTLVPGRLGGSETYVRGLLGGLARVGELDYRVLLPPAAPEAAEGLDADVAVEYRRAGSVPVEARGDGARGRAPRIHSARGSRMRTSSTTR